MKTKQSAKPATKGKKADRKADVENLPVSGRLTKSIKGGGARGKA